MPIQDLQINTLNIAAIKQKFSELYKDDSQKCFPFVNRFMLGELIVSIEEDIEKQRLGFFAFFRKLRPSSKPPALKPFYEAAHLLQFCISAMPTNAWGMHSLYDLILAKLSCVEASGGVVKQTDERLLLKQSACTQKLALDTLVLRFHDSLPVEVMPLSVLSLLKMLQHKPVTFAAFLLWAFERGMRFTQLIESGLFQHVIGQQKTNLVFITEIVQLLILYKDTESAVSAFLKAASLIACGADDCSYHNLLGVTCAFPFSDEQINESKQLGQTYASKPLVVAPEHVHYLYKTFGSLYAVQLLQQLNDGVSSAARQNLHEVIGYLTTPDFIVFIEALVFEKKRSASLQNACRSKFYALVSKFERLIADEVKQRKQFATDFFSRSFRAWELLSKAATLFLSLAWEIQWDYPDQYAYCALMLQHWFEVHKEAECDVIPAAESMRSFLDDKVSVDEFLFRIALASRSVAVQRRIAKECTFTVESKLGGGETLFLRALKAPGKALAREILSLSQPEAIKRLFIGESNHQYSFFRNMAKQPGLLYRFMGALPLDAFSLELLHEDWHGDTVAHWLAGSSEAVELIFPLIPTPLQKRLLQISNREQETFLHKGAKNSALLRLSYHHYAKEDLLKRDAQGNTVFHRAASSKEALEILLSKFDRVEYDAILTTPNNLGQCVLLCAANSPEALKFLLNYYSNERVFTLKDTNGNTIFHLASVHTESFSYLFRRLGVSNHSKCLHDKNKYGQTVLSLSQRNEDLRGLDLNSLAAKVSPTYRSMPEIVITKVPSLSIPPKLPPIYGNLFARDKDEPPMLKRGEREREFLFQV